MKDAFYPEDALARAMIVWAHEGTCACGHALLIGKLDGKPVAHACHRCGAKK